MNLEKKIILLILIFATACAPAISAPSSLEDEQIQATPDVVANILPTPELTFSPYDLRSLSDRIYGAGEFLVEFPWQEQNEFTRYKVVYDSDGLEIHGFVNIPKGKGPFPVVVALHGYIPASEYETLDYSTRYADSIARKGYIVLHPNMRNFPPSDSVGRRRDYLTGYTIDVMNMIAHVQRLSKEEGSIFQDADFSRMGVWGHSLGGGVALRIASLVSDVQAVVAYAAVSQRYTNASTGIEIFAFQASNAAFSVHHGTQDEVISVAWSERLCQQLEEAGKQPECFYYQEQPHTFYAQGTSDALFIERTVRFFEQHLRG